MKPIHDFFALKASFAKLLRLQKLPFRITPQIERYLEDILYLHDKWLANTKEEVLYWIGKQLKDEPDLSEDDEKNNSSFWDYLKENRLAMALPHHWTMEGFAITPLIGKSEWWPANPKEEDIDAFLEDENMLIEIPGEWDRRVAEIMSRKSSSDLIAITRSYTDKGFPVQKIYAKQKSIQKNSEEDKIFPQDYADKGVIKSPYEMILVSEIELIRELYNHIKNKGQEEHAKDKNGYNKPSVQNMQDSKIRFDSLNGVIRYGDEVVRFHRGERSNKPRLALFRVLWELKKYIKNGKIKAKGESFPPEALAVRINLISGASDFQRNKPKQEQFFGLIKGINRELRNKKIPAQIERNNGIQLVITEK
ncbi:MAG: hypothetical protein UV75_C0002G0174 [Candidatus Giovannonibacteria bacterium GW2011_GWA1_43_15]|uniref:Uncharacterized protein n=2 Tax=Candidatus Giovannoniibacteriota TaxID=1752738 RepID=A0A0G1IY17_9BACT|nr:MAG: hypothetical protein UV72_C0001G0004 [Candidatus Giovannonibacteria bacterium GW2011_GWB1_43_13]KKS99793.1 MAG: hypothetical protein UV75_C0002G0174 [Candidatus Giovannonibacteria bacterium GW2011_GWA1_43_15]KKT63878.1 MAG: hypothetical protein UW55_C0001G0171 [Candidatus Giovannonibacteria bacterium GW2011_GWA2_44_26]OGF92779.1 MAG: hypothetical protein A3H05_00415 [Candidatus Giovannonibacteria bacterium RIFCSPLOWO2_12_FULL_43_26]